MELFSNENIQLEEKLNNQIADLNTKYKESNNVAHPNDIIQIIDGKKVVNTIKRKDKTIKDFGEEITGARKDAWKLRGLDLNDLAALTEAEKDKLIEKKNILRLDANYLMKEKNVPREVAIFAEIILRKISAKPNFHYTTTKTLEDKQKAIENYVAVLKDIQNFIENSKTLDEAKGLHKYFKEKYCISEQNIINNLYVTLKNKETIDSDINFDLKTVINNVANIATSPSTIHKAGCDYLIQNIDKYKNLDDAMKDLADKYKLHQAFPLNNKNSRYYLSFELDYAEKKELQNKIDINYPNVAEEDLWKTRIAIIESATIHKTPTFRIVDSKSFTTLSSKNFNDRESVEAFAKNFYEEKFAKITKTSRPKKTLVEPEKRETFEVLPQSNTYTEEQLLKTFKLRGGQFGNYQDNRQIILDNTYVAFDVLAKTMKVDPEFISLGNTLAIAFGARGVPGAAAHYETSQIVINLTKLGGAGSLAHEWGHSLDHILGESITSIYSKDSTLVSAGGNFLSDATQNLSYGKRVLINQNPVVEELFKRNSELIEALKYSGTDEKGIKVKTKFYEDALHYDVGRTNPYWSIPKEMFARAFETFISDTLIENKEPCNYLVSGITKQNPENIGCSAYPQGEDRKNINEKMKAFINFVSEHQIELMSPIVEITKERKAQMQQKKAKTKKEQEIEM